MKGGESMSATTPRNVVQVFYPPPTTPIIGIVAELPRVVYDAVQHKRMPYCSVSEFIRLLRRARYGIYSSIVLVIVGIGIVMCEFIFKNEMNYDDLHPLSQIGATLLLCGFALGILVSAKYFLIIRCNTRLWRNWLALQRHIRNLEPRIKRSLEKLQLIPKIHPKDEVTIRVIKYLRMRTLQQLSRKERSLSAQIAEWVQRGKIIPQGILEPLEWDIHLLEHTAAELEDILQEFG